MFFDLSYFDKELMSMILMTKHFIIKLGNKEKINRVKCPR